MRLAAQRSRREHLPAEVIRTVAARLGSVARVDAIPLEARVPRDVPPTEVNLRVTLAHFQGNVARVAEYFGKDRHQIYRWADHHGIDRSEYGRRDDGATSKKSDG